MKNLWWGYLHTQGTIQAKRFFSQLDICEAKESPFVRTVVGSFEADSREEAIAHIKKELGVEKTNT